MKKLGMGWAVAGMVMLGMVIPCSWGLGGRTVDAASTESTATAGKLAATNTAEDAALYETVAGLDKTLFAAVNGCDLEKLGRMVTEDLEFYHDKTGLAVGKKIFLESIKNNVCGKVQRELVAGSLEVYPLAGYGAVEIGVHRFHHPGVEKDGVGEAKFIHVWQLKDGAWRIARVISFDHGEAKK